MPDKLKIIAQSKDVEVEALAHKSLPIYSWQAHLEATSLFNPIQKQEILNQKNLFTEGKTLLENFFNWITKKV